MIIMFENLGQVRWLAVIAVALTVASFLTVAFAEGEGFAAVVFGLGGVVAAVLSLNEGG